MRKITRTIYGAALQTSLYRGIPHVIVDNTTLNEKFDIIADAKPKPNDVLAMRYLCIGLGGHRHVTGAEGIPYTTPITHRANHAALYKHNPFVIRRQNDDLTVAERAKYGLRRTEVHNGERYFAYYLKRIENIDSTPIMEHTTIIDGVTTTVPFTPTNADLNPVPPEIPSTGVLATHGNYLSVTSTATIIFDEWDVAELKNVARVLYDNELFAVISEMALCSGVDRVVTGDGPDNSSINYTEVVGVQIAAHITAYYSVGFTNQGFNFEIDLGATEPLVSDSDVILAGNQP